MRIKRVTLRDVAQAAGVSLTTASIILNEKPGYSFHPDTVQRVWAVARSTGYLPSQENQSAPAEAKNTIFIVTASMSGYYYAALVQGIEQQADAQGYTTFCYQIYRQEEREEHIIRHAVESRAAGIIFTYLPIHHDMLESLDIPVVVVYEHHRQLHLNCVETNNTYAARQLIRHLTGLGHTKIGFLNDRFDWEGFPSSPREARFREAFESLCPEGELVTFNKRVDFALRDRFFEYRHRARAGYELAQTALTQRPDLTALVCVCDVYALGAIQFLREHHLTVPGDCSVCGFDNNYAGEMLDLTTFDHRTEVIGVTAFNLLLERIRAGENKGLLQKIEVVGELIVRGSTGPVRQKKCLTVQID